MVRTGQDKPRDLGELLLDNNFFGTSEIPVSKVKPAYEKVADQLRQLILKNKLAPGDRLPVEGELCSIFGVSRSTIREALRDLAAQDLVHTTRGTTGGTFVSRTDASKVSHHLETSLGLMSGAESISVAEIIEAREVIEIPAAKFACLRATPAHLTSMQQILDQERASIERGAQFRKHRNFHGIIVQASGNSLLQIMNDPVFKVLQTRYLRQDVPTSFWRRVDKDHQEILAHIVARDEARAELAMRRHLERLRVLYQDPAHEPQ